MNWKGVEESDRDVTEVLSLLLPGQKQRNHKKKKKKKQIPQSTYLNDIRIGKLQNTSKVCYRYVIALSASHVLPRMGSGLLFERSRITSKAK
jgi:hypothetical protein